MKKGIEPTYGPTALLTPANIITVARIVATPVFVFLVVANEPSWTTFIVGFSIGMSDFVDGWLARRQGATRSGAFLDPLADKVLVLGGMSALVANQQFHWVPVAVIALRELVISAYRSRVGRRGITVPATKAAKWKTFFQGSTLLLAVMPPLKHHDWIIDTVLWCAVVMTLITGWQYIRSSSLATAAINERQV